MGPPFRDERVGKYLVYYVNKGLSIVPTQKLDRLYFIIIGENCRDQGDALICGKGTANQTFPRWNSVAQGTAGQINKCVVPGLRLTCRTNFVIRVDVGGLSDPGIVGSVYIACPLKSGGLAVADAHCQRLPT